MCLISDPTPKTKSAALQTTCVIWEKFKSIKNLLKNVDFKPQFDSTPQIFSDFEVFETCDFWMAPSCFWLSYITGSCNIEQNVKKVLGRFQDKVTVLYHNSN